MPLLLLQSRTAFAVPPSAAQILQTRRALPTPAARGGASTSSRRRYSATTTTTSCVAAAPPSGRRRGNGGRGSRAKLPAAQRPTGNSSSSTTNNNNNTSDAAAGRRGGGSGGSHAARRRQQQQPATTAAAAQQLLERAVAGRQADADAARRRPREKALALGQLVLGARVEGVVRNLVRHGAYVDVGAVTDGLVHVRDMSVQFVYSPSDCVRSGDTVSVWIKYVDPVRNVLGLTMVPPAGRAGFNQRTPVKELVVGERVEGVVARVTNYGAYVDLGAERHGFVHVSALWGRRPRETLENLRLGAKILVHVDEVDEVRSFIRLRARGRRVEIPLEKDGELGEIHEELRNFGVKNGTVGPAPNQVQATPIPSIAREFVLQRFGTELASSDIHQDARSSSEEDEDEDEDEADDEEDDEDADIADGDDDYDDEYELDIFDDSSVMRFQPGRQKLSVLADFGVADMSEDDHDNEEDDDMSSPGNAKRPLADEDLDEEWSEPSTSPSYGLDDFGR